MKIYMVSLLHRATINEYWDSAYLCQGTSYQCRNTDPDPWFALPPKFNYLFFGPLPTFPENFMQIHLEVSAQSC